MGQSSPFWVLSVLVCLLVPQISAQGRAKAFAAPTGPNAIDIEGSDKHFFKAGPTKDGIINAIADEVQPGIVLNFVPDSPFDFPAYDDNLIPPNKENEVFIPDFYKNETEKEKAQKTTTTTRAPPPTRAPFRPTLGTQPPPVFIPTRAPPRPLPQRPPPASNPRPFQPVPFQPQTLRTAPPPTRRPQQFVPQTRPPPPPRPQQPFTQRPFQQPQFVAQTRPPPPPQRPQQQQFFTQRPPQPRPFFPQQPQFQRPPPPQAPVQQPRPITTPPPTPAPTQRPLPAAPQQPHFGRQPFSQRPFVPQQFTQRPSFNTTPAPRPLRPFRPQNPAQRPSRPSGGVRDPTGLRTGVCPFTIFYQHSTAPASDAQQSYTHFAVVVSVDQCARTCNEFNCDYAFFDPRTRHCQFNPAHKDSQAAASCPKYPSPLLRNNVPLSAVPLRISCITCQRRRRRNRTRGRFFTSHFSQGRRQFRPQVIGRSVSNVVHGVLLRQPQSVAIGFGQPIPREDSFQSKESHARESDEVETPPSSAESIALKELPSAENDFIKVNVKESKLPPVEQIKSTEQLLTFTSQEQEQEPQHPASREDGVVDSSTEDNGEDLRITESSREAFHKKYLHRNSGRFALPIHRIQAADKLAESAEFA